MEDRTDKRKIRLVLLAMVGVIVLAIGIKAAVIFLEPMDLYLPSSQHLRELELARRTAELHAWVLRWIIRPVGLFVILTAALVVSRLILSRSRPPPDSG